MNFKRHVLIAMMASTFVICPLASGAFAAPDDQREHRQELRAEDAAAYLDARIAAFKVGLRLTPAQEKEAGVAATTDRIMMAATTRTLIPIRTRITMAVPATTRPASTIQDAIGKGAGSSVIIAEWCAGFAFAVDGVARWLGLTVLGRL